MPQPFRATLLALAAFTVVSVACKKEAPAPPAPLPPPPAPIAMAGVTLGKAIGPDKAVTAPASTFGVRDTIYASVATSGASAGATLTAIWTFGASQRVDSTSQSIAPTGAANTEFHITKATPWPVGKYRVAIMLDGGAPMEREFEVTK